MSRHTFLQWAGIAQFLVGLMYFFLPAATTALFVTDTCHSSLLIANTLGSLLMAFGLLNFLARKSPGTTALRAIMAATLFYLILSAVYDAYSTLTGSLTPPTWGLITIRLLFITGYLYYISKMQMETKGSI